jgi:hypothetical protein
MRKIVLGVFALPALVTLVAGCLTDRELGAGCSSDVNCKSGYCRDGFDAEMSKVCTLPCDDDDESSCPAGFVCLTHNYAFKAPESYCWSEDVPPGG